MDISIIFPIIYIIVWAIGGWVTGLVLKNTGLAIQGGHLFLMFLGWGLAGILGLVGIFILSGGDIFEELTHFAMYGLFVGVIGGIVTIRQIAKAQKRK